MSRPNEDNNDYKPPITKESQVDFVFSTCSDRLATFLSYLT